MYEDQTRTYYEQEHNTGANDGTVNQTSKLLTPGQNINKSETKNTPVLLHSFLAWMGNTDQNI